MPDKTVVVRLRAAVGEYTSGLARAGGQTVTFAGQLSRAAREQQGAVNQAKNTMASLATGAALAGKLILAGVGGAMVVSAKAAIDFESSLAGVAKTVDGTNQQIQAIGESMRRLSLRIPVNVNELNRIAELGGQLGIQIPNLVEFTEVVAALGVTTNLSTEEAATGLARLANVTGASQEDFDRLGSALVELGNNFATTESEILTFALRIGPAAQTVGVSAAEVLGLSAALSSLGIPAERGGTAIQRMFTTIAQAAAVGGPKLEAMALLTRMTTEEFAKLADSDPTEALVEIASGLRRVTDEGGNVFTALESIGAEGVRTISVLLALSNNTDLLTRALETSDTAMDENTALFEEAARRYGTTSSEIRLMSNAFTDLRIELGRGLLPGVRNIVRVFTELFRMMKDNVGTVRAIGIALAVLGGVGLILGVAKLAGAVVGLISGVRTAIAVLRGGTGVMAAFGVAAGGMAGIVGLVLVGILGILGKKAFDAAQKIAELRESVESFDFAIQQGTEPREALVAEMLNLGINLKETDTGLRLVGSSLEDLLAIGSTSNIQQLETLARVINAALDDLDLREASGIALGIDISGIESERRDLEIALAAIDKVLGFSQVRMEERAEAMALAALAAGAAGGRSVEQLVQAAKNFLAADSMLSDSEFVAFLQGQGGRTSFLWLLKGLEDTDRGVLKVSKHWTAFVREGLGEEGSDRVADFFTNTAQLAQDWAEQIDDALSEARASILDSFPTWDEYETVVIRSLDAVFAAQDKYLADVRAWAEVQPEILGIATEATENWLAALDTPTLGALARRWQGNTTLMSDEIGRLNTNLGKAAEIADDFASAKLPRIISKLGRTLGPEAARVVSELFEGLQPSPRMRLNAYTDVFRDTFRELPDKVGGFSKEAILALVDPRELGIEGGLKQIGVDIAQLVGEGFRIGLNKNDFSITITRQLVDPTIKTLRKGFESQSPSRVAMREGEYFSEGFIIGLHKGMKDLDLPAQRVLPSVTSMATSQVRQATTPGSTVNHWTINLEGTGDPETDARRVGAQASVLRRMETR